MIVGGSGAVPDLAGGCLESPRPGDGLSSLYDEEVAACRLVGM